MRFGLLGAFGGFVAALLGELLLWIILPEPDGPPVQPAKPAVDVMFVLDVTGSMADEIRGVRDGIQSFVEEFRDRELNARVGLIAFRDRQIGEEMDVLMFEEGPFTADTDDFRRQVGLLSADGGGDGPESSLDAVVTAAKQPFREGAVKVLLLITDAPPKIPDLSTSSMLGAVHAVAEARIDQLHLVIQDADRSTYQQLQVSTPGKIHSLAETAAGREGFELALPDLGTAIAELIPVSPITSGSSADPGRLRFFVATGLWTAFLAVGIFLALVIAQSLYLGQRLLASRQAGLGSTGSLLIGFCAGLLGHVAFSAAASALGADAADTLGRFTAWIVLGACLACGVAFFIPNLRRVRAFVGGAIGGGIGAVCFSALSAQLSDTVGRLVGAAILGLVIGLLVALIEAVFRSVWLEVSYGPRETVAVNLGESDVTVGSDSRGCTVFVAGAPPMALRYRLVGNQIQCEDVLSGTVSTIFPGDQKTLGKATLRICAANAKHSARASE